MKKNKSEHKLASLLIINYNGKKHVLELLESLKKTDYPNYEIIVVDNGSTDGSAQAIEKKFPRVKIVKNKENLGASGGKNEGMKLTRGDYVIILDNDMVAHDPKWLSELVKAAESDKKIGIAGMIMMRYDNPDIIERSWMEEPTGISKIIMNLFGTSFYRYGSKNEKDVGQFKNIEDVKEVGAGLIKREVIGKIGGFDEKLFCYFEDTDFSYRAKKAGFRVVRAPNSRIIHKGAATMKHGYFSYYQFYKNKIRFILKNYDTISKITAITFTLFYYSVFMILYILKGRPDLSRAVRDAVLWNVKNWKDYL